MARRGELRARSQPRGPILTPRAKGAVECIDKAGLIVIPLQFESAQPPSGTAI